MAEFQVTASELKEKAELLRQLGERYANKVQELILAQHEAECEAGRVREKQHIDRVFQEDCIKMDLFRQTCGGVLIRCCCRLLRDMNRQRAVVLELWGQAV